MKLTRETKGIIDSKTYDELYSRWRMASVGEPWFQGETGEYWQERMIELSKAEKGAENARA